MRFRLKHWLMLLCLMTGALLLGACKVECDCDADNDVEDVIDEVGDEIEELIEDDDDA